MHAGDRHGRKKKKEGKRERKDGERLFWSSDQATAGSASSTTRFFPPRCVFFFFLPFFFFCFGARVSSCLTRSRCKGHTSTHKKTKKCIHTSQNDDDHDLLPRSHGYFIFLFLSFLLFFWFRTRLAHCANPLASLHLRAQSSAGCRLCARCVFGGPN